MFLMVGSTLGYAIQSNLGGNTATTGNNPEIEYNGFKFTYTNGFWVFGSFVFRNSPKDIPDITGDDLKNIESYRDMPLYIQSSSEEAENEAYLNLGQVVERIQKACTDDSDCVGGLPIKTCDDNFIIISESEKESIRQDRGCVYIEGKKENLVMLVDQFLFKILGVK